MLEKKDRYRLTKNFFEENPLNEISAAQFMYFQIMTCLSPELNDGMEKIIIPALKTGRRQEYEHGSCTCGYEICGAAL